MHWKRNAVSLNPQLSEGKGYVMNEILALIGGINPEAIGFLIGISIAGFVIFKILKKVRGAAKNALGDKLGDVANLMDDDD